MTIDHSFRSDASKMKWSWIVRFFFLSLWFSWLSSVIYLILILTYASTGYRETVVFRFFLFFARLCHFNAQIFFLLVLILCAKGYLIVVYQLSKSTVVEIILIGFVYTLVQVIILIVSATVSTSHPSDRDRWIPSLAADCRPCVDPWKDRAHLWLNSSDDLPAKWNLVSRFVDLDAEEFWEAVFALPDLFCLVKQESDACVIHSVYVCGNST